MARADRPYDDDRITDTARSNCSATDQKAKKSLLIRPRTTARSSQRRL